MTIEYPAIMKFQSDSVELNWSTRDTMLYALGVGYGDEPTEPRALRFTYERELLALPTFAATLAAGAEPRPDQLGIDVSRMLHAGQKIELRKAFPAQGHATASARVVAVQDKGAEKGALIVYAVDLSDAPDQVFASATTTLMARGDGGFDGPKVLDADAPPTRPQRDPDAIVHLKTQPGQALLYRLSGEMNPLHADPEIARAAGFERPILQGPCTFGMTLRAVLEAWPELSPLDLRSHEVRFAAPLYPGDTLSVRLWRNDGEIHFEADVLDKRLTVIKNGRSLFAPS